MGHRTDTAPIWVSALLDKDLSPVEYRVWSYLYWRQGDNGHAWPSQRTVAADLRLTVQAVRNVTRQLAAKGWLRIERPNVAGRGHYCRYSLVVPSKKVNGGLPFQGEKRSTAVELFRTEKVNGDTQKRSTAAPPNTIQRTLTHKKAMRRAEYTPEFDRLWAEYPRKEKKFDAFEVWQTLAPDSALQERILASVREHKTCEQWTKDAGQYVPLLITFLNGRRWEDVLPAKPEPQPGDPDWVPTEEELEARQAAFRVQEAAHVR